MIETMDKTYIIPSKNCEGGSLLLNIPLDLIEIPAWLSNYSTALGYKAKDEYHVTVIGLDLAGLIREQDKTAHVKTLVDNFTWTIEVSTEYIELAKDDMNRIHRQSIVGIVNVPELTQFYEELKNILGRSISFPPTHVTLYTKNYDRGIGLYNENDLHQFKVRDLTESSKLTH